jgi:hypothetical protein
MIILTAPQTWPFGAALATMVGLAVIEGAGLLFAASPTLWLDNLLPDMPDNPDGLLGWLHVGRVPLLVLLILFLTGFAVSGYAVQTATYQMVGTLLPAWLAALPAVFAGLSTVSAGGSVLAKLFPGDQTSAVSVHSLLGRAGVVVRGIARQGLAAEAKVCDAHGHMHYVMVEPDISGDTLDEGCPILLVRKVGARFHAIVNPHPELF